MELVPPFFDDSGRTKYPVLFRVYGGPGSQMVHTRFDVDWHSYLVCSLKYVVGVVDGRGTGFKGRKLRNPIRENMGNWETIDQIEAAKSVVLLNDSSLSLTKVPMRVQNLGYETLR